jgi:hypothetical protein
VAADEGDTIAYIGRRIKELESIIAGSQGG